MRSAKYAVFYLAQRGGKAHLRSWVTDSAECRGSVALGSEQIHIIGNSEIAKISPVICQKCFEISQREG